MLLNSGKEALETKSEIPSTKEVSKGFVISGNKSPLNEALDN